MEGTLRFGSINFSDYEGRDESSDVKNGADVNNLAVKDSSINENVNVEGGPLKSKDVKHRRPYYRLRPDAENCPFYMRYGCCKFGLNCRYNHPFNRTTQASNKTKKPKEEECKYHLTPQGCKHGKACIYNHSGQKPVVPPVLEFNFLGLPIRPGEKECPRYTQTGSCKYGSSCWFDHPEPFLYTGFEDAMPFWSLAGPVNGFDPFGTYMYQPAQCAPSSEWIGYQVPLEQPEAPINPTSGKSQFNPPVTGHSSLHHDAKPYQQQQNILLAKTSSCPVNDKGLPLRPETEVCGFYVRYGVCKLGAACKFDHPVPQVKPVPNTGFEEAQLPDSTTDDKN